MTLILAYIICLLCTATACYFAVKFSDQMLKDAIKAKAAKEMPFTETFYIHHETVRPIKFRTEMFTNDEPGRNAPFEYIRSRMIEQMLKELPEDIFYIDMVSPYEKIDSNTSSSRYYEIMDCQRRRLFKYRGEINVIPYRQAQHF